MKTVRETRSVLDFDELHLTKKDTAKQERHATTIIRKHIEQCYIASWICEAEELEDMFGDLLLSAFLVRLAMMREEAKRHSVTVKGTKGREYFPDEVLRAEARRYVSSITIAEYTGNAFSQYRDNIQNIRIAPKDQRRRITAWRTGEHGESGLGYRLNTTLRTESDTAQAEASLSVYQDAGVPKYLYNAILDDKTCGRCRNLHGRVFLVSEKQPGVNFPRLHPNCRCYIEPIMD